MIIYQKQKAVNKLEWHSKFVLFPKKTLEGHWVFFQKVYRKVDQSKMPTQARLQSPVPYIHLNEWLYCLDPKPAELIN